MPKIITPLSPNFFRIHHSIQMIATSNAVAISEILKQLVNITFD
jgi:hypothetical protein